MSYYATDTSFRLKNLILRDHPILGANEFKLSNVEDIALDSPYVTVIIGPNGTGKSEILRCLLLIFRNFYSNFISEIDTDITISYKPLQFFYELNYTLDGVDYKFSNSQPKMFQLLTGKKSSRYPDGKLFFNNTEIVDLNNDNFNKVFPQQIVAQAIMMTDKFFVPRNEKDKRSFAPYHYLGIRNRPQQSSTGYYVRRTVELIIKAIDKKYFKSGITKLTNYINASKSFVIQYRTINTKKFYNGELTDQILDEYFDEIEANYKNKQAPYKLGHYNRLKKSHETFISLIDFTNGLSKDQRFEKISNSDAKKLNFDLLDSNQMEFLKAHQYDIDWLRKIGLLSSPTIKFSDKDVELQNASSGEFHLFTTMIGLMASTSKNSLILIDEPETSLHPNWQMQYLKFIRELFKGTDRVSSHIILATHSHFLISDLEGDSGNILGLHKKNGIISSLEIQRDTFGWSAEEVLYKVFEVRTTRNYYLEMNLHELLYLISIKTKDRQKVLKLLKPIEAVQLNEEDPLRKIVAIAQKYLQNL